MIRLAADFETTVYSGIEKTEVWLAGFAEIFGDREFTCQSIDEFFKEVFKLDQNTIIYFHNLKFDGSFIIDYLLNTLKWQQAYVGSIEDCDVRFVKNKYMFNRTFKYIISDMGVWYSITIKYRNHYYEIRDSLKLLPFSLAQIGKAFNTKHQKLTMEYEGFRYAGCEITEEEYEYFRHDLYVLKEALEVTFQEGHTKITIGSCCLSEYIKTIGKDDFELMYPDLREFEFSWGETVEQFIRDSYKGGWCYVKEDIVGMLLHNGTTFDVNSLYPSVMESPNKYPVCAPTIWEGNYVPDEINREDIYYFIRIKCRFSLKENHLPFVQIKKSFYYKGNECLKTSDIYNEKTGRYEKYSYIDGIKKLNTVELTFTKEEYALFKDHYNIYGEEIIGGCWFHAIDGIFTEYIEKYKKIKENSTGAVRTLAKLFLNNLYGKFASSQDSSFKVALGREEMVKFFSIPANDREPLFIAVASAITGKARNTTIRAAQLNYETFAYSDTDSIHLYETDEDNVKGIKLDNKKFGYWCPENKWDTGWFVRQKTYIEKLDNDYIVKCAGMPIRCKQLLIKTFGEECTLDGKTIEIIPKNEDEKIFLSEKRNIEDFKTGIIVPGKLRSKRIPGGVVLVDTTFQLK